MPWSGLDPVGLVLGLLSVLAFSASGVLNRIVVDKGVGCRPDDWPDKSDGSVGLWDDQTCFLWSREVSLYELVVVVWPTSGVHSLY